MQLTVQLRYYAYPQGISTVLQLDYVSASYVNAVATPIMHVCKNDNLISAVLQCPESVVEAIFESHGFLKAKNNYPPQTQQFLRHPDYIWYSTVVIWVAHNSLTAF